jgi:AraC-like DNA-binding protein
MSRIPSSLVDTAWVMGRERFSFWREALAATHEVELPDGADAAQFSASARGWNLGRSLVLESRSTPQRLRRPESTIRRDQIDHYIVRLQRSGQWTGESGGHTINAPEGTLMVLDMARPSDATTTDIENVNVVLPRDMLDGLLPPFELHGLVVKGPMSALLRSHLESLSVNLPGMLRTEADGVADATCSLIAACLAPSRDAIARARSPLEAARLSEIRRYIDRHLCSPQLTPDNICAALGVSRSTLYAACEPMGGVAAFIQKRRLQCIHAILADPREHRLISEIAYQHGFANKAHFSRVFRQTFGYTASEAREMNFAHVRGYRSPTHATESYRTWVRELAGQAPEQSRH